MSRIRDRIGTLKLMEKYLTEVLDVLRFEDFLKRNLRLDWN